MKVVYQEDRYFRYYTEEETDEFFIPLIEKIFVDPNEPGTLYGALPLGPKAFANPAWKVLALPCCPLNSMQQNYPDVQISGTVAQIVEPATGTRWDYLRPLWVTLLEFGITDIIASGAYPKRGEQKGKRRWPSDDPFDTFSGAIALPPRSDLLDQLYEAPVFMAAHTNVFLFSKEANWGIWGEEEQFGVIGGEPEFMDQLLAKSGGEALWRRCFDHEIHYNQAVDSARVTRGYIKRLYDCVGWPQPDYIRDDKEAPPYPA